jgi:hypothetical protein
MEKSLFSSTLHKFGYAPCHGDPDVYVRKQNNKSMRASGDIYTLKHDSLRPPAVYLGANIGEVILFIPARMDVQETDFTRTDWADIYGEIKVKVTIESSALGA